MNTIGTSSIQVVLRCPLLLLLLPLLLLPSPFLVLLPPPPPPHYYYYYYYYYYRCLVFFFCSPSIDPAASPNLVNATAILPSISTSTLLSKREVRRATF